MVNKTKWIYWVLQILGWGAFIVLLGITEYLSNQFDKSTVYQLLILYISLLGVTHVMRFVFIRLEWLNLKIIPLIPRAVLLCYLSALFITFVLLLTNSVLSSQPLNRGVIPTLFLNSLIYMLFLLMWTSIYMTYHLFQKNRKQELAFVELRASQVEMELKNLRNQLNPHFLFNALNSIRALIQENPEKSKEAITNLSGVLRGSLQMGKKTVVSLTEEKQLVLDYLELEKIRYEERLSYQLTDETKSDWLIPPFSIQTLTENAIKHGISKLAKGGEINILIKEANQELHISVRNTGKLKHSDQHGIGLENVRKRLYFQFNKNAYFHIQQIEDNVEAKIIIKKSNESSNN